MYVRVLVTSNSVHHATLREHLKGIQRHNVDVVQYNATIDDVPDLINLHQPDIVILDPSLDNAYSLREWPDRYGVTPVLICVCDREDFAVDAFNAGAVHYLATPIKLDHVEIAIQRAITRIVKYDREGGNGNGAREIRAPFQCRVIALPSIDGIEIRNHEDLFSAHGEGNYTRVVLRQEGSMLLARTLKDVEPSLSQAGLMRVHRSHMINPSQVRKVRRGKSPVVELSNGEEVDVSERYKELLFAMLQIKSRKQQ